MSSEVIERLASYAHYIWASWTRYMLSNNDAAHQERWRRQAYAAYRDLPETEKESDRHIAQKWLDAIGQTGLADKVQELHDLVEYKDTLIADYKVQMARLQAHIAELEADAKLGRMVREMPEGAVLDHVTMTSGRTFFVYTELRPAWGFHSICREDAETPLQALEAVRSKP